MKVLVACEFSGIVREAFKAKGHDAWSCDYLPTEIEGNHYQGPVEMGILDLGWDLMIAHPPCTFLCSSGLHWNIRRPERKIETDKALDFVRLLMAAPIKKIAIENPIGCISTKIRKPEQIIHPWMFGHDASKSTCLWLKNLSLLNPTDIIKKKRYSNQTASGQNKLPPSQDRGKLRSISYQGIANAMASQWGYVEVQRNLTERKNNMMENPPAFPELHFPNLKEISNRGMSLRDWFAGQALIAVYKEKGEYGFTSVDSGMYPITLSQRCYELADAMLKARGQSYDTAA